MTTPKRWGAWGTEHYKPLVIAIYGTTCHLCGEPIPQGQFSIDHVIPRSRGGDPFDIANMRPACMDRCNKRRGNKLIEEYKPKPKASRQW